MSVKLHSMKAEDTALGCKFEIVFTASKEHRSQYLKMMADMNIIEVIDDVMKGNGDEIKDKKE